MKSFRKHFVLGFMLSLVLLYSTPIKSLHNCSNLNHHHHGLAFETAHEDCQICGLQFFPFIAASKPDYKGISTFLTPIYTSHTGKIYPVDCHTYFNKGPPLIA